MAPLTISPFITRELGRALRRDARGRARFWIAAAAVVACLAAIPLASGSKTREVGMLLFGGLLGWGLCHAYWVAVTHAPASFGEDRGSGMLALLFLAGLNSAEIFTAKLLGVLIAGATRILGIVPCFLVAILMLRLPWAFLAAALCILAAWLVLSLGINVLASVLTDDPSAVRMLSDFTIAAVCGLTPALNSASKLFGGVPIDPSWLALSPAYGPWILVVGPRGTPLSTVFISAGWAALLGLVLLAAAGVILNQSWQSEIQPGAGPRWMGALVRRLRAMQKRRAESLLEVSPYGWLIARDFRPVLVAWLAVGLVLGAWSIGLWNWSRFWLVPINIWVTCLFLSEVVRFLVHYLAAKQIGHDRASGGLEIVLTTGLNLEELLGGLEEVARRFVRPLNITVACTMAAFFVAGLFARAWTPPALASYFLVWIAVAFFGPWTGRGYWIGFWVSLHTGRPGYALRRRLLQYTGLVTLIVQFYANYKKLIKFPSGSNEELWLVGGVAAFMAVALPFGFRHEAKTRREFRRKILERLREAASHPIPSPDDPRLKKWNPYEPFYGRPEEKILV